MEALRKRHEQQTERLTATRKECHRRRLLLLAQQQLMDAGPGAYNRCPFCPKAFINDSFLKAHLQRRHPGEKPPPTLIEPEPRERKSDIDLVLSKLQEIPSLVSDCFCLRLERVYRIRF